MIWRTEIERVGAVHIDAYTWYAARDIARLLFQGEAYEPCWRRLEPFTPLPGTPIYFKDDRGDIQTRAAPPFSEVVIREPSPPRSKPIKATVAQVKAVIRRSVSKMTAKSRKR
jgi:hypothetical protein